MKWIMVIFWVLNGQPTIGYIPFNDLDACLAARSNIEYDAEFAGGILTEVKVRTTCVKTGAW